MANDETKKERVVFQIETGPVEVVYNILKEYNLEESLEESHKKIERGGSPRVSIVIHAAADLVLNKISETDFISILEKRLEITRQIAEKIAEDVKKELISTAKKITVKESETLKEEPLLVEKPILATPIKPPVGLGGKSTEEIGLVPDISLPARKQPIRKKPKKEEKIEKLTEPVKKETKKPDVYREPIE